MVAATARTLRPPASSRPPGPGRLIAGPRSARRGGRMPQRAPRPLPRRSRTRNSVTGAVAGTQANQPPARSPDATTFAGRPAAPRQDATMVRAAPEGRQAGQAQALAASPTMRANPGPGQTSRTAGARTAKSVLPTAASIHRRRRTRGPRPFRAPHSSATRPEPPARVLVPGEEKMAWAIDEWAIQPFQIALEQTEPNPQMVPAALSPPRAPAPPGKTIGRNGDWRRIRP